MLASSTWSSIRSKRVKISKQMSWRVKRKLIASNARSTTTLLNWKSCYNTMRRLRSSNRLHLANSRHLPHTLPLRNHYAPSSISSTNSRTIRSLIKPQRVQIGRRSLSRVKTLPKWPYPSSNSARSSLIVTSQTWKISEHHHRSPTQMPKTTRN